MGTVGLVLFSTFVLYCLKRYLDYKAALKSIGYVL